MRYVGRHDEILQQCLARVGDARVLNESGDGFLVRFSDPSDAVPPFIGSEVCRREVEGFWNVAGHSGGR